MLSKLIVLKIITSTIFNINFLKKYSFYINMILLSVLFFNPISRVIVIATNRTTANNNKHIITSMLLEFCEYDNYFFCMLLFYHQVRCQLYSIFHFYILLLIYRLDVFSHEQFLICKYSPILHALLHLLLCVLGFHTIFGRAPSIQYFTLTHTFIMIPFLL